MRLIKDNRSSAGHYHESGRSYHPRATSDTLTAVTITITADGQVYTPQVTNGIFTQSITLSTAKTYAVTVTATDEAGDQTTVQRNVIYVKPSTGDITADGNATIADALMVLKIAVGLIAMDTKYLADGDVAPYIDESRNLMVKLTSPTRC